MRLISTNVLVIRVNMVPHVRIKLMDLPAAVHLDLQVEVLPVSVRVSSLSVCYFVTVIH